MTQQANRLLAEALHLSEDERGAIAASLIDSLDLDSDAGVDTAWSAEILKRLDEIRSGQVKAIPWPQARQLILDDTDDSVDP